MLSRISWKQPVLFFEPFSLFSRKLFIRFPFLKYAHTLYHLLQLLALSDLLFKKVRFLFPYFAFCGHSHSFFVVFSLPVFMFHNFLPEFPQAFVSLFVLLDLRPKHPAIFAGRGYLVECRFVDSFLLLTELIRILRGQTLKSACVLFSVQKQACSSPGCESSQENAPRDGKGRFNSGTSMASGCAACTDNRMISPFSILLFLLFDI